MQYKIDYKLLSDELIVNEKTKDLFNFVRDSANEHSLELSNEEFKSFFRLAKGFPSPAPYAGRTEHA